MTKTDLRDVAIMTEALRVHEEVPRCFVAPYTGSDEGVALANRILEEVVLGSDPDSYHALWDRVAPSAAGFTRELVARRRAGRLRRKSIVFVITRDANGAIDVREEYLISIIRQEVPPYGRAMAVGWRWLSGSEAEAEISSRFTTRK